MSTRSTRLASAWSATPDEIVDALAVSPAVGLSASQARQRLAEYGPNLLKKIEPRSLWSILAAQFKSLLVALLAMALIAAFAFGEWVEGGAILAVLFINALIGFVTELRAARSMEALRKLGATRATVLRDGKSALVAAEKLVPGDVVLVDGGDVITADLRIVKGSKLQADESTLTGESLPTDKSPSPVPADAAISDRSSMLFKGTVITRGSGVAVVVSTGMSSELGKISQLVAQAKVDTTPLEKRLNRLAHALVWLTLFIAMLVAASSYAAGRPLYLVIETSIALAVAAVPEGLPVIATIALARGMRRMAQHKALINRLSAVETLGATSVICTDKTGTLTENRMRVGRLSLIGAEDVRRRALEIATLCNNASLGDAGIEGGVGDPMELALLAAAAEDGIHRSELLQRSPEQRELAFDPEMKMMATIHGTSAPYRVAVKGAPEPVLEHSSLAEVEREHWIAESERMAEGGLRVLALAERMIEDPGQEIYASLGFVGLVGLLDPPREEVRDTIEACRRAGLRVVMVTGDHPATARNIAQATGLVGDEEPDVILGSELEDITSLTTSMRRRLLDAAVFARVSPKQKLNLVGLHQAGGSIIAMTGDGVNDAPALRKADIGVAMGGRGTAAAKEAAAMVLQDDDLSTIAEAIAEGRTIFDNIRSFVVYLLSCNLSEILVVALAVAVQAPLPLLPLQILFLNLVTDVFPALALGVGEAAADIMERPPREANEAVISPRHWRSIIIHGLLMTASVLGAFGVALAYFNRPSKEAVTISFMTLALTQLWHVFNMRRASSDILRNEITRNPWIWAALVLCVGILLAATYIPPLAEILSLAPPSVASWTLILGMSLIPLMAGQAIKLVQVGQTRARQQA